MSTPANNKLSYHESLPICDHAHCLRQAILRANHRQMFHWLHPILHNTQFISELIANSASWFIPRIPQLLDARMGDGLTRSFSPFLDGQPTDQASTNNIHLISQIDHHATDHEFSATTLAHSDMFFMFFSIKWTVNPQIRHLCIHRHTISPFHF
jgi:hypothetical protein